MAGWAQPFFSAGIKCIEACETLVRVFFSRTRVIFPDCRADAVKKSTATWLTLGVVIGLALLWAVGLDKGSEGSNSGDINLPRADPVMDIGEEAVPVVVAAPGKAAWETVDPATVDELPEYKEVVPGRALVRISESLQGWEEGDEVALAIPQLGGSFDGIVERVDDDLWGNRSYIGLLKEENGRDYRFVITVGPENVFAQLGTSRGTFELVASDEIGWLMASRFMDQHVDYSQLDYYIVEETPPNGE